MAIPPLPLIREEQLSIKPSTGKLPLGGLPRNRVVRIIARPNMTSAVYRGRKATIAWASTLSEQSLFVHMQKA